MKPAYQGSSYAQISEPLLYPYIKIAAARSNRTHSESGFHLT